MNKKKVIICRGIPASGKTTWAKSMLEKSPGKYKKVNKDLLREMLDDSKWSGDNEKFIISIRNTMILEALKSGKHVIVDDTNLAPKHVTAITELVKGLADVEIKPFDIPLYEAIERDKKRENPVGRKVILNMWEKFLKPEKPVHDPSLPSAIIVDIDGTVAKMDGRGPYDWNKVGSDIPNKPVIEVVRRMSKTYQIIICTGRDGVCEDITREWLRVNYIPYDYFYIRPAGDNRKDSIIKKEIYDNNIAGKYNILFCLDDRNQVVDMYRGLGLDVLQCDYGDF